MGATETREYITTTNQTQRAVALAYCTTHRPAGRAGDAKAKAEVLARARAAVVPDGCVCADQYCAVPLGVRPGASPLGS